MAVCSEAQGSNHICFTCFFITLFFTLLFSLVPPAPPGTHEHLLRLRWPLDRHHFTTFLVTIELTTFSTTLLAFDLWRNYYIKHVVLFEENSIESGPEKETSVRPEKETRDRIRALFSMAQSRLESFALLNCFAFVMEATSVNDWCSMMLGDGADGSAASPAKSSVDCSMSLDDLERMESTSAGVVFSPELPPAVGESSQTVAAAASSSAAASSPASSDADLPRPREPDTKDRLIYEDPIYRNWVPTIKEPLEPLSDMRGRFTRKVRCCSMFDGLSTDKKGLQLFSIPTSWSFTCENCPHANSFKCGNFDEPAEHMLLDARDFLEGDGNNLTCFSHDFAKCKLSEMQEPGEMDIMVVTCSCRPYAIGRIGRMRDGTTNHEDAWHIDAFKAAFNKILPKAVLFEQVFGFALAESVSDTQSPLQSLLSWFARFHPDYAVQVFYVEGNVFLVLSRHRVYVVALENSSGGKDGLEMLKRAVMVTMLKLVRDSV